MTALLGLCLHLNSIMEGAVNERLVEGLTTAKPAKGHQGQAVVQQMQRRGRPLSRGTLMGLLTDERIWSSCRILEKGGVEGTFKSTF